LTNHPIYGILLVSRGDREHLFQAGLGTMCGGRKKPAETLGKSQSSKKNVKNPLTKPLKCDTIRVSRGEGRAVPTAEINRHLSLDKAGARAHSPHWLGYARSETHESRVRPIKSERARPAIQIK
jgi:hypothetical protein